MLDLVHVSKTFNPGTVADEKKALDDGNPSSGKGDFVTLIGSERGGQIHPDGGGGR